MERAKLSLRWLEVFRVVASSGSVQQAAQRLGLSISTASQHLGALEDAVGIALIDHSKRPMRLTPAGQVFLGRVDEALGALNRGVTEIWSRDPGSWVRRLVISSIEDLDVAVIPPLASELARVMPGSELVFLSRSSHETVTLLEADDADLGITATAVRGETHLLEMPLLRDPYLMVLPAGRSVPAEACLDGTTDLVFLRYSKHQVIGQRVELQLRRLRKDLPRRFEFESTDPILAMVAEGQAWTITTALNVACLDRYRDRVKLVPIPGGSFARPVSLIARADLPIALVKMVENALRSLVLAKMIAPTCASAPWLNDSFSLLPALGDLDNG